VAEELWRLGVNQLSAGYRQRRFTPLEVVESCLARLERVDPEIHAFVAVDQDRVRTDAGRATRELASGRATGALFGVPVAVKEIIGVEGAATTASTEVALPWGDRPAAADAPAVAALRAAGAIVFGLTRTHEFAWGITSRHARLGGVANPWRLDRIAGGSSGGSAAAVAAGIVPLALGTDTGGSVRIPAANCGVVGWKLDHRPDLLPGVIPLAPSFDSLGVMTRSVPDALTALGQLPSPAPAAAGTAGARGLLVGALRSPHWPTPTAEIADQVDQAEAAVTAAGATVEEVRPAWLADVYDVYLTTQMWEARQAHEERFGTWPGQAGAYGPDLKARLTAAGGVSAETYKTARERGATIKAEAARLLERYACLLAPTTASGPSSIDDPDNVAVAGASMPYRDAVLPFTVIANVAGLQAVSIPTGFDRDGLPLAVQVIGIDPDLVARVALAVDARRAIAAAWPPPLGGSRR
jgi:Asp-tRNA(Asn)/Glu-tRNA(Gln) amidotransferase A subunit family amidase